MADKGQKKTKEVKKPKAEKPKGSDGKKPKKTYE